MTLQVQFLTLALMAGCGITLGACFDTIEVSVREFRLHRLLQALIDVAYWVAATILVFRVLVYANFGEVRLFIFLGLAIGVLLYFLLVGSLYRKLLVGIIHLLKKIVLTTIKVFRVLILKPLLFIYRLLVKLILAIVGIITTVSIFLGKVMLQWGKVVWKWIRERFVGGS